MSDNIVLASSVLDDFHDTKVKEIFESKPWMRDKKFILLTKPHEVSDYIDACIEKGVASLDLETTGLNTRLKPDGTRYTEIVGICIAHDINEGVYIAVSHEYAEDYNVSLNHCLNELKRLASNCKLVFHNFKYDGEILRNHGIVIEDPEMFEDTMIMAAIEDASRKNKGLKYLSEALLGRPQLEITDMGVMGSKKNVVAFAMVPPQKAVYYGAGDGMNTLALYFYLKKSMEKLDPTKKDGLWIVYLIEKRCLLVTMEMERNYVKVDKEYLAEQLVAVNKKMEAMVKAIYKLAERRFDINSTQQLGAILFDEMGLKYPPKEEKTKTGHYKTNSEVLESVQPKHEIIELILGYRTMEKIRGTYLENLLNNADENDEIKFQLNQVRADTGRFSGSGGKGLKVDGYCGVNCQNIPVFNPKEKYSVNLRRAIVAHPGWKILSIDYSGEELRIAANFSKEQKWLNEFLHGTGDLHTITGQIITGKQDISKQERSVGKTLNFLTLYGGGAGGFAAQAKIPYGTAKKMIMNFFREYTGINNWITNECKRCRKRGYSKTAFGRRRPLHEFYDAPDKGIQAKGDRCAINSAVQGTGADLIKIALYKVYSWIRKNQLQDDLRILLPVHDEIVFEIREDKLDAIVPELCEVMKMRETTDGLGWSVPLEVDAEYGDSFHVDHDFWKERKDLKKENVVKVDDREPKKKEEDSSENIIKIEDSITENKKEVEETSDKKDSTPKVSDTIKKNDKEEFSTYNENESYVVNTAVREAMFEGVDFKKDAAGVVNRIEERVDVPLFKDAKIEDRFDSNGFFCYAAKINPVVIRHFKHVMEILSSSGSSLYTGPKTKIALVDEEGIVYWKTKEKFSLDGFLALCQAYNI